MVVIDNKLINNVRELIFNKDARQLPRTFKRMYKGVNLNHKTLEYRNERGRTTYVAVPVSAIHYASRRGAFRKFEAIKTAGPVKIGNQNIRQWLFTRGEYTTGEVRRYAQRLSNKFANEGKNGQMAVALRSYGEDRGVWTSGRLKPYGEHIEFLVADSDGLPLPERHSGFTILFADE